MSGFKNFILRGNLVDLAVAVIIGGAFATVVTAFTNLLLSIISKVIGDQPSFDTVEVGGILVGPFLTALVAFLILAAVVYFFVVVPYVKARERFFPSPAPGTPEDIELLRQIRDLLQAQGGGQVPPPPAPPQA